MKTKAVWHPPQQEPDPEIDVFNTEIAEDTDRSGKILSRRYKLVRRVGAGATASVYEAKHVTTGARLAVKILHPGLHEHLRGFFGQEGRIAARHNCPHLVQAIDFGECHKIAYTVFSFAAGKPLCFLTGYGGSPIPWRRLCRILLQVLEALAVLHKSGIVHRDLHSSNILVDESRDDFAVVIDVGFAAVMPPRRITQGPEPTRRVYGMYSYVAPETRAGCPPDPRMDLYAVGVLMFELLTGLEMIDYGRNFGMLAVPPLRVLAPGLEIPEAVDAIALRALSDVSARFASADDMAAAIRAALDEADAEEALAGRSALRPAAVAGFGVTASVIGGLVVGGMFLAAQPAMPTLAVMNATAEAPIRALDLGPSVDEPAPTDPQPVIPPADPPAHAVESEPASSPWPPPVTPAPPVGGIVQTKVAGDSSRPRLQLTTEQRLIRKARRSILDCKPDSSLANAAVLIERRPDGAVMVRFNGRPTQGQFGRCVADFAATATLGPEGQLRFAL